MESKLYILGTPIGNLGDLSDRAKATLQEVDFVLCEDTRVTSKLMSVFEIVKPLESVHQHTEDKKLAKIIKKIKNGESAVFVSDAGMPGISDPGGRLVEFALKSEIEVIPIPGPSAVTAILSVSGFPADKFTFLGFAPHKKGRNKFFDEIEKTCHTVVLFESKHRIMKALDALPQNRKAVVGREITKLHETYYRGTIEEIKNRIENTKGEFTIVLAPKKF